MCPNLSIQFILLLLVFQVKHFVCDFPLQTQYMIGKFKETGWQVPLACHAGVHALATFLICLTKLETLPSLFLALFDFAAHFTMDRIKASPNLLGRFKALDANSYTSVAAFANGDFLGAQLSADQQAEKKQWAIQRLKSNVYFWWSLGLDQMVHHLTHYLIIMVLL